MSLPLEKQVVSLELAKRLKELGAVSLAEHYEHYGGYYVTQNGKVYSIKYGNIRELKPSESKGYLRVALSSHNRRRIYPVHRVVAKVFIKNPDNKPQVNHKDGNKQNNCIENLEWYTASENMQHASRILKRPGSKTGYRFSNIYPSEAVRNRLIALGIPRNRHNLADLGEMLPSGTRIVQWLVDGKMYWNVSNVDGLTDVNADSSIGEADARAKMLIYLIENGLITV